ncbi:terminase small subunit [Solibacillus sp. FSL K6-1781]|uniref:terminase small subunit n=1 Tax=Solibacillus sp. FSL K6-1781 TaxID=2921474 RepID=UPI00315A4C16
MINWEEIKHEYETTKITLAKLAEMHDIPLGTIKSQKSRDTKNGNPWVRDCTKKDATKSEKVATIKQDAKQRKKAVESEDVVEFENDSFTDKQRLFIAYYVKCWNATKAYQKAYECSRTVALVNGPRLLGNARIKAEVIRVRDELTQEALLDKRTLIQKWIDIAFADITDYVQFGTETVETLDDMGKPIEYKVSYTHLNDSNELDGTLITEVKKGKDGITIKLADKMKALEFLSKHMDLLNEREVKQLQAEKLKIEINKIKNPDTNTQESEIAKMLRRMAGDAT